MPSSRRIFPTQELKPGLSHCRRILYHWATWELEKAMAPHSRRLAWKIPWVEEPSRLQSWGRWELDRTERLHFHFSLSCIGEGNGNPLQCSCLETPRDGGAWWAAIYGVAWSRTRVKQLSSSSTLKILYQSTRAVAHKRKKRGQAMDGSRKSHFCYQATGLQMQAPSGQVAFTSCKLQ